MAGGRPLKFQDPDEFAEIVESYFEDCKTNDNVPTVTGLAVWLDTSRETLREYKEREEFVDTIKRALNKCEAELESRALSNKVNPTIAIFSLKNNYGWKDRTEVDTTGEVKHTYEELDDDKLEAAIQARENRAS